MKDALLQRTWVRDIVGAPTAPVLCDYVALWEKLENVQLQVAVPDRFIWRWTADGKYSASSAYQSFFIGMSSMIGAKQLWKVKVPLKVKFFFWIALHGRLWTAERRWRHGLQQQGTCVLCDQELETTNHLLASCVYAKGTWYHCLQLAGMQTFAPQGDVTVVDWWLSTRKVVPKAA